MPATLTCLDACTDEACNSGCFDADPACGECVDTAWTACAVSKGCSAQVMALDTCLAACTSDTCSECDPQYMAIDDCVPAGLCDSAGGPCFGM